MRVLIADDEAPARRKLARFLGEHADIEIVAEASNGIDAIDLVAIEKPDVVFLDVQMPDLDGIGVAEALSQQKRPPRIVFVTAFDSYAVAAFEVRAADYLLKPFDRERFGKALDRVRSAGAAGSSKDLADLLARVRRDEGFARRLLAGDGTRSRFVPVSDVVRIEAEENRVVLHCRDGQYTVRATLEAIETRLDPDRFARVGRSHIVNIDCVAEVNSWFHGDYKLRLRNGEELMWSRRYATKRKDLFKP